MEPQRKHVAQRLESAVIAVPWSVCCGLDNTHAYNAKGRKLSEEFSASGGGIDRMHPGGIRKVERVCLGRFYLSSRTRMRSVEQCAHSQNYERLGEGQCQHVAQRCTWSGTSLLRAFLHVLEIRMRTMKQCADSWEITAPKTTTVTVERN